MKALAQFLIVLAMSVSSAVFANDTACREEARKAGYVGAVELLPSCEAEQSARAEREEKAGITISIAERKPDPQAVAQAKQPVTR